MSYPTRQFVVLAGILAGGVTSLGADAAAVAKTAGLRFGHDAARPGARSVAEVLTRLDALGADYRVEGDRILAGNCIFSEACINARPVICGVQAGILEGALRGAGMEATVEPQGPLPARGCAYLVTNALPESATP
jgi:predicted ArsR family transcriptional regulator